MNDDFTTFRSELRKILYKTQKECEDEIKKAMKIHKIKWIFWYFFISICFCLPINTIITDVLRSLIGHNKYYITILICMFSFGFTSFICWILIFMHELRVKKYRGDEII